LAAAALVAGGETSLFAAPVNLLEEVAHHADQSRDQSKEREKKGDCSP
jgi:hypothetical protein